MGYHAPSAEEVYDYIFRVNRHAPQSLCDGFGWSILFVNDGSQACKDFLMRYATELCYRTADRVRFVFFSGLTREETNEFAGKANTEWGNRQRIGFLPRIIKAMGRPHNQFEWEREQWDELRPAAFHPLDSRERIDRHLDMECEINTVMPGAEEALRLAQRIGIGRFVPCFLLFSDVGSPSVYLFPMAGRSPDVVFDRLRRWIDTFYEVNNPTLLHWAETEESVKKISEELKSSVYAMSRWQGERLGEWKTLRKLAFYQHALKRTSPDISLLEKIEADKDIALEIKRTIRTFREQWCAIEQRIAKAHEAMEWIENLKTLQNPKTIYEKLLQFKDQAGVGMPESLRDAIIAARKVFKAPPLPRSPDVCVFQWWGSKEGIRLTKSLYDHYRSAWSAYSIAKYGVSALDHVGEILREEFAVVQESAGAQPVGIDSKSAADEVLLALAKHLGVSAEDAAWRQAVSSYRGNLVEYFTRLKNHVPEWIAEFGNALVPCLCWGECIPTDDQLKKKGAYQCLQLLPRLNAIIERAARDWDATTRAAERRQLEQQNNALTDIFSCVMEWVSAGNSLESDKLSIWLAVVSSLSGIRKDLEEKVFAHIKEGKSALFPKRVFRGDTTRLLRLLDEYDQAVRSLVMPFENDSEVLRLSLDIPLSHISGLKARTPATSPAVEVRNRLLSATADAEEAMEQWNSVRSESIEFSPAGRLYQALRDILPLSRMEELLSGLGSEDIQEAVVALSDRQQIVQVLDHLYLQELVAVENTVCLEASRLKFAKPDTKDGILQSILVAIGLADSVQPVDDDRCQADLLKEKASHGNFDVFLAHNSEDRASVMCLGSRLRDRGIYPWIDVEQVPPGRWFQDVLQSAIRTVKSAAIIIGTSGIGRWQAVEMRAFISRCVESNIPVIPVLLPGAHAIPAELMFLRGLTQVSFKNDVTEDAGIDNLIWGITGQKQNML